MQPKQPKQPAVKPAAYAKMRGLNRSTVSRQIHSGVIPVDKKGLVDPEAADQAREQSLDSARRASAQRRKQARATRKQAPKPKGKRETFADAQARKERALADIREIEAAGRRSEVIEVALVEAEWAAIGVQLRNGVLGLSSAVCNRIPAELRREVSAVLDDEARKLLTMLSDKVRSGDSRHV